MSTNSFVITFGTPSLPTEERAGYIQVAVSPYISNPLRCIKCQNMDAILTIATRLRVQTVEVKNMMLFVVRTFPKVSTQHPPKCVPLDTEK